MKIEAIVSGDVPFAVGVNALAHATLGVFAKLRSLPDERATANVASNLVAASIDVTIRSSAEIFAERAAAAARSICSVDFVDTMTGDTYVEQLEKTKAKSTSDLRYYALIAVVDP